MAAILYFPFETGDFNLNFDGNGGPFKTKIFGPLSEFSKIPDFGGSVSGYPLLCHFALSFLLLLESEPDSAQPYPIK